MNEHYLVSSFVTEHPLSRQRPQQIDGSRVVHNLVCMGLVRTRGRRPGELTHSFWNQGLGLSEIIRENMIETCSVPVRCGGYGLGVKERGVRDRCRRRHMHMHRQRHRDTHTDRHTPLETPEPFRHNSIK